MRKLSTLAVALILAAGTGAWILRALRAPDGNAPPVSSSAASSPRPLASHAAKASGEASKPRGPAGSAPQPPPFGSVEEFLGARARGTWSISRSDTGAVTAIAGGQVPDAGKDRGSALALARDLASVLGIDRAQVQERPGPEGATLTPLTIVYRFAQKYDDVDVYGEGISIHARKSDGAVFIINNDLKRIDALNPTPALSAADAEALVRQRYQDRGPRIAWPKPERVVWANGVPQELAWMLIVEVARPEYNKYSVIVGADTGKVLLERSVLQN